MEQLSWWRNRKILSKILSLSRNQHRKSRKLTEERARAFPCLTAAATVCLRATVIMIDAWRLFWSPVNKRLWDLSSVVGCCCRGEGRKKIDHPVLEFLRATMERLRTMTYANASYSVLKFWVMWVKKWWHQLFPIFADKCVRARRDKTFSEIEMLLSHQSES